MVTFETFRTKCESVGLKSFKQSDSIFFVKPAALGAGKVELNLNSETFTVGSGSKHLEAITDAVSAAGFILKKKVKNWSVFEPVNGMGSLDDHMIISSVIELATVVEQVCISRVPLKAPKASKVAAAKKTLDAFNELKSEIKAKNLETMRAVSKRLGKLRVVPEVVSDKTTDDYDPQLIKEEIDEVIAANVPSEILNKPYIAAE
jgi:hypothetical protein